MKSNFFLLSSFLMLLSTNIIAQDQPYADFQITVSQNEGEIHMECHDGCTWENISFKPMVKMMVQSINQNGMMSVEGQNQSKEDSSDFIFTIRLKDENVVLEGKSNVAWKKLVIDLSGNQERRFNAMGMLN